MTRPAKRKRVRGEPTPDAASSSPKKRVKSDGDTEASKTCHLQQLPNELLIKIIKDFDHPTDWFALIRVDSRIRSVCEMMWPGARLARKLEAYSQPPIADDFGFSRYGLGRGVFGYYFQAQVSFTSIHVDAEFQDFQANQRAELQHLFCFVCRKVRPRADYLDGDEATKVTAALRRTLSSLIPLRTRADEY